MQAFIGQPKKIADEGMSMYRPMPFFPARGSQSLVALHTSIHQATAERNR